MRGPLPRSVFGQLALVIALVLVGAGVLAVLLGRELAVWRADDGNVNVWENRCLHRGVRLSIGINDGAELKCQYHGWRYANRTAGCTYIPAHPADAFRKFGMDAAVAVLHLPCAGPMVAAAVWVPLLEPLCSAAVL